MRKFQEGLKQKAHIFKIKQAKTTILASIKPQTKYANNKTGSEANLLLQLYQKKNYDSIPAYKLLRTAGLQQYTRGFIQRGYGINLGKLALISEDEKKLLYEQLKILPGHTTKLDKIIESLAKSSYLPSSSLYQDSSYPESAQTMHKQQQKSKLKVLNKKDYDYQKQLQRVLNEYTPQSSTSQQKKKVFNITKNSDRKPPVPYSSISNQNIMGTETKYTKSKFSAHIVSDKSLDFKKKTGETSTKTTIRKNVNQNENKRESLNKLLKKIDKGSSGSMSTKQIMQINLQFDKVKSLNRSFDGALMTSTIANIDVEELIYAFSGFIAFKVVVAKQQNNETFYRQEYQNKSNQEEEDIEDEVGQILKESFLHPLYKENQEVQQDLAGDQDAYSEGQEDMQQQYNDNTDRIDQTQEQQEGSKLMESSFLDGAESVHFGLAHPMKIFDEPEPTAIDYFKPTIDSVSNFIKNIVLTAKMEREIPIMAAAYLQNFIQKTSLVLTSLNYRRLLVSVLLLASKIWDDQSFQTPSFSKTFPQYSTVLLNQMEKLIVKALDYKLKIDKKQYTKIYFKMRKYTKQNIKSYQNRKLNLQRIRQLQLGIKKDYKSNFMSKRNSY